MGWLSSEGSLRSLGRPFGPTRGVNKGAIKWTRLSCRRSRRTPCGSSFMHSPTISSFLRTLATPEPTKDLVADEREAEADQDRRAGRHPRTHRRLSDGRVAIPRQMFQEILRLIAERSRRPTGPVRGPSATRP